MATTERFGPWKPRHGNSLKTSIKSSLSGVIRHLPDPFDIAPFIMRDYRRHFGRYPHVWFPKTFNEKVQARKIFDRRRQLAAWTDKYAVREYVRRKIGAAALPPLLYTTRNPSDIPFDELPDKYVVKASHGSGWVQIVQDASTLDRQGLIDKCNLWLSLNYWDISREWVYKDVVPRILVEEFLDPGTGRVPIDYKFFVFDGGTKAIQVNVDRFIDHKQDFYDADWNKLDFWKRIKNCDFAIARPEKLETMLDYARILSDNIDFIRVDLYEVRHQVYFGELTSLPASGFGQFWPSSWDKTFGDFWKLRTT